ncbi:D-sedoheptulose 7-phosphate isomerase [Halobacteriovorax sp. XZX-3]|uniref:D-sedoheptulose 7-phosphate isomerase n=1 Tax=unclassified Halobacteriovorax TaxID=2639665 RepID=UPI000CD290B6|nr:D-sedoheptulose 7-phosphate isomerase [Halobacteriovorax sp. DA5]POB13770.1 phosphoheptose isomerase [Halobacteriovorax sp. DA5]
MSNYISHAFNHAQETLTKFIANEENFTTMEKAINEMVVAIKNGGRVISCGNGGSMCDAMHFAEELTGRFRKDRPAMPAIAIADSSHITCVANDYGFEYIFSKYVEAHGHKGDVLLAISTSGNSPNCLEAVKSAHEKGMKVVGLLGKGGGKMKELVDFPIVIEADLSDRIQEMHIKIIHTFIEGIERQVFPQNY